MMRESRAPLARAAWANSMSRIRRNSPRMNLASVVHDVRPSAIMIVTNDGRNSATIPRTRRRKGKQRTISIRRDTIQSATPP